MPFVPERLLAAPKTFPVICETRMRKAAHKIPLAVPPILQRAVPFTILPMMDKQQRYHYAHVLLRCAVMGVLVYGSGMVLAGRAVAGTLFDALGFGPTTHALDHNGETYAIFCFGVLGSVIVGWMLSLYFLLDMCDLRGNGTSSMNNDHHGAVVVRQSARWGIFLSASIWFTFDTTFSIVVGEYNHALFNIPFVTLFLVPLQVMHWNDGNAETLSWSQGNESDKLLANANRGPSSSTHQRKSNN